jgi:hypothetical protein
MQAAQLYLNIKGNELGLHMLAWNNNQAVLKENASF